MKYVTPRFHLLMSMVLLIGIAFPAAAIAQEAPASTSQAQPETETMPSEASDNPATLEEQEAPAEDTDESNASDVGPVRQYPLSSPRGKIQKAISLVEAGDYPLARTWLAPALIDPRLSRAERSRAYYLRGFTFAAQDMLVSAYKDYNRALEFNPDNAVVLVEVGLAHAYGRGVERNPELAYSFFEQAANREFSLGYVHTGRALLEGLGVDKNVPEARAILEQAADNGHALAMLNLASSYRSIHVAEPDPDKALEWYAKALAAGEPRALLMMGRMYAGDELGAPNPQRAVELYQQALDEGVDAAAVQLAYAYVTGTGVDENAERAFELYQRAADKGVRASYIGLGHMFENGLGTDTDPNSAQVWYMRAAQAGIIEGASRLVGLYLKQPSQEARTEALRWSARAAASGSARAQNDYAWLLATSKFDQLRNGTLAVRNAREAVAQSASAAHLDTLAAAFAEMGDFAAAIETQQQALDAIADNEQHLRGELESRLQLYRRSQPFRE